MSRHFLHSYNLAACIALIVATLLLLALVLLSQLPEELKVGAFVTLELSLQASFVGLNEEVDALVGREGPLKVTAVYLVLTWGIIAALVAAIGVHADDLSQDCQLLYWLSVAMLFSATVAGGLSIAVITRRPQRERAL